MHVRLKRLSIRFRIHVAMVFAFKEYKTFAKNGTSGGLVVSALVPGASGLGLSPGRGLCCVLGQDT